MNNKQYFPENIDDAIIAYNELIKSGYIKESHDIFTKIIYPAFLKLSENVLNVWKFNLYNEAFDDVKYDLVSYLFSKMDGFNKNNGKGFSYFTIIAKNYLIARSNDFKVSSQHNINIDLFSQDESIDSDNIKLFQPTINPDFTEFFELWVCWCESNLNKLFSGKKELSIADSVLELIRNSHDSDIYNKKLLYILIRERSNVNTQNITRVVNIFKDLYENMYAEYLDKGYIIRNKYIRKYNEK